MHSANKTKVEVVRRKVPLKIRSIGSKMKPIQLDCILGIDDQSHLLLVIPFDSVEESIKVFNKLLKSSLKETN